MVQARFESIWRFVTPAAGGLRPLHISPRPAVERRRQRRRRIVNDREEFSLPDFGRYERRKKNTKKREERSRLETSRPQPFIGSIRVDFIPLDVTTSFIFAVAVPSPRVAFYYIRLVKVYRPCRRRRRKSIRETNARRNAECQAIFRVRVCSFARDILCSVS